MSSMKRHLIAIATALVSGGITALIVWFMGMEFRLGVIIAVAAAYIAETITDAVIKGTTRGYIGIVIALAVSGAAFLGIRLTDVNYAVVIVAMAVTTVLFGCITKRKDG